MQALAHQVHLLHDGAGVSAGTDRDPSAATAARAAAAALLGAALAAPGTDTRTARRRTGD
ncbi:hypothetical protein ABTX81_06430 [Kitasatospora sp. NPDC097605]|uniref:hypothetical protein n=1 Tax=Kitasatospora sp. NPDC097605 TaxID=3157226 RepID=UPI0033344C55